MTHASRQPGGAYTITCHWRTPLPKWKKIQRIEVFTFGCALVKVPWEISNAASQRAMRDSGHRVALKVPLGCTRNT